MVSMSCMAVVHMAMDRPPQPYNAGTEHVGFSPTRQAMTLLAPSAKRREVFGELHSAKNRLCSSGESGYYVVILWNPSCLCTQQAQVSVQPAGDQISLPAST